MAVSFWNFVLRLLYYTSNSHTSMLKEFRAITKVHNGGQFKKYHYFFAYCISHISMVLKVFGPISKTFKIIIINYFFNMKEDVQENSSHPWNERRLMCLCKKKISWIQTEQKKTSVAWLQPATLILTEKPGVVNPNSVGKLSRRLTCLYYVSSAFVNFKEHN